MKLPDGITVKDQWVSNDGWWLHMLVDVDSARFPPSRWQRVRRWVVNLVTLR